MKLEQFESLKADLEDISLALKKLEDSVALIRQALGDVNEGLSLEAEPTPPESGAV